MTATEERSRLEAQVLADVSAEIMLTALREHEFAQLESVLDLAQGRFESGEGGEEELQRLIRMFDHPDATLGEHFSSWMDATPLHYGKLLALGRWLFAMGVESRGGQTANLVSDRGWRELHTALEQAEHFSQLATTLAPRPFHAFLLQSSLKQVVGCQMTEDDVREGHFPAWYSQGLALNPDSLLLRENLLFSLRTEWGGSEAMMLEYVRQQERSGFPNIQKLWALYHASVAHYACHFQEDAQTAVERAKMAAELSPLKYRPLLFEMLAEAKAPQAELEPVLRDILKDLTPEQELSNNFYLAFWKLQEWYDPYVRPVGEHMLERARRGDDTALNLLALFKAYRPAYAWVEIMPLLEASRERGNVKSASSIVNLRRQENEKNPTKASDFQLRKDLLRAAEMGDPGACWQVVSQFDAFESDFQLTTDDRIRLSLVAADGGSNPARELVASLILQNVLRLTEDGRLELVHNENWQLPTQHSLDYARWLLERAAATGYEQAEKMLNSTPDWRWDAEEIRRRSERYENRQNFGRGAQRQPEAASSTPSPQPEKSAAKRGLGGLWGRLTGKKG